jgi:ABC-type sulfate/molybdate transport systems ATPase subunit
LPLAFRGIVAATILSFARALGEFGATLMLAGNIPGQTQTMPVAIFFAAEAGDFEQALIWVLIILAISLSVIWSANYWAKDVYQKSSPKSKRAIAASHVKDHLVPLRDAELVVDLQKQLASFPLDLSFSGDSHALGILGASGSGKSMLLRCIAGLETPDHGYIRLNGRTLFDSSQGINLPSRDRKIGFVFQNYALFPHLTVAQNIAFGLRAFSKLERDRKIAAQLHQLHLEELEHRYPHQLSGGQQQRVALARALASDPEALLLDEPFSALDTYLRSQLEQQMVTRLTDYDGVTLFVTHNLEEAYRICPNLMVMDNGSAIAQGTKQSIFEHPDTYTVARLTGCKNFSRATVESANVIHAVDWGIHIHVIESIPDQLAYIGIRAHQFVMFPDMSQPNSFPCWLTKTSETPHRMTIFLKFNSPPTDAEDYHVQAEVFKEKWFTLKDRSLPWSVQLDPLRLILMRSS